MRDLVNGPARHRRIGNKDWIVRAVLTALLVSTGIAVDVLLFLSVRGSGQ